MNKSLIWAACLTLIVLLANGCGPKKGHTVAERRAAVQEMEAATLERLYQEAPETKQMIKNAVGYGVFSNANINLIFASAGGGYGVVVDNQTGHRTYMKMALGGIGLGVGVKDYRVVMIFKNKATMTQFVEKGWDFGAHADAAATTGDQGAEASTEGDLNTNIDVYSMTEAGLALQATVAGTKYWKDKSLN